VPAVARARDFDDPRSPAFAKNVVAISPHRRQNVIANDPDRESLATDSRDSRRIRRAETLAHASFPIFFSAAIKHFSAASTKPFRRRPRLAQRLKAASC
jgi:hypothetical protein